MPIPQITRIIRRSNQGATRPFVCHADDGNVYFVKGKSASTGERIREWMGGNLASAFGLTVPHMSLLEIPRFLISSGKDNDVKTDLGAGCAVGSQQVLSAHELLHDEIALIPVSIQRQVLLFDYWVRNEDRTLSTFGGNPNLLWSKVRQVLYAIDYNLILPDDFNEQAFRQTHAFSKTAGLEKLTAQEQQQYQQSMQSALAMWSHYWQQLPEEWLDENDSTSAFDEKAVLQQLEEDANGKIWRRTQS